MRDLIEREAACRAECGHCRDGVPLCENNRDYHQMPNGHQVTCSALMLRRLPSVDPVAEFKAAVVKEMQWQQDKWRTLYERHGWDWAGHYKIAAEDLIRLVRDFPAAGGGEEVTATLAVAVVAAENIPESPRCETCRWWDRMGGTFDGRVHGFCRAALPMVSTAARGSWVQTLAADWCSHWTAPVREARHD